MIFLSLKIVVDGGISQRLKLTLIIVQLLFLRINGLLRLKSHFLNGSLGCRAFPVWGMMSLGLLLGKEFGL